MYTVKQLADIAQVSVRTLHYYDQIDLLPPSSVGENGYRYYDDAALYRLQQILFYREMGLELLHIKDVLDRPDFNLVSALNAHREALQTKIERLEHLINTVDETIQDLTGESVMSKKRLFEAFSEEQQKDYEREVRLQYDPQFVNDSIKRWNSYSKAQQDAVMAEAGEIYTDLAAAMEAGTAAQSAEVQAIMARWHENLRNFYEPTLEILRGLGETYNTDPRFIANFQQVHPELPGYLYEAVAYYVDELETAEIARMLAEDDAARRIGD